MVEGTSALSESVALRGEAPEGEPRLACASRRSYSKSRRESHARDPGVRRPPRRGTSVGHHHVMATCVSTFSAHTSTVTGPSLGPPTCASCAGHLPGRTCCIARVKSSVAHVGESRGAGPVGKTWAGWQASKARRLHAPASSPEREVLRAKRSGSRPSSRRDTKARSGHARKSCDCRNEQAASGLK